MKIEVDLWDTHVVTVLDQSAVPDGDFRGKLVEFPHVNLQVGGPLVDNLLNCFASER
jgi:hypothetical protein